MILDYPIDDANQQKYRHSLVPLIEKDDTPIMR